MKKKKFCFSVKLDILELNSVPYVNGTFFAKLRQIDGGTFCNESKRVPVDNHRVIWTHCSKFQCKMVAPVQTGILEECLTRVSVRKEARSGKVEKLGFVDLDLAQFCGVGATEKRCILAGYDVKRRQDNSILKLCLTVSLISGDPVYKRPFTSSDMVTSPSIDPGDARAGASRARGVEILDQGRIQTPASSRPSSPANLACAQDSSSDPVSASTTPATSLCIQRDADSISPPCASSAPAAQANVMSPVLTVRTSSNQRNFQRPRSDTVAGMARATGPASPPPLSVSAADTLPRVAKRLTDPGAASRGHSRNLSWDGHSLASTGAASSMSQSAAAKPSNRFMASRVNAQDLVESLLRDSSAAIDEGSSGSGADPCLQLFINKDGGTVVSGRSSGRHLDRYMPVTIKPGT